MGNMVVAWVIVPPYFGFPSASHHLDGVVVVAEAVLDDVVSTGVDVVFEVDT